MRAKGYRWALAWLAGNDDCSWLHEPDPSPSIAAGLVADIYGVDAARVERDLRAHIKREAK